MVDLEQEADFVGKESVLYRAATYRAFLGGLVRWRSIYPPLLADRGLPTALEAQARKAAVLVSVEANGVERYPPDVESAVYFCCPALQIVAKYAHATPSRRAFVGWQ